MFNYELASRSRSQTGYSCTCLSHTFLFFLLCRAAMVNLKRCLLLSIVFLLDTVDRLLRMCGVKLYKLTTPRILASLTSEQLQETNQPDVARPFQLFIKVMIVACAVQP